MKLRKFHKGLQEYRATRFAHRLYIAQLSATLFEEGWYRVSEFSPHFLKMVPCEEIHPDSRKVFPQKKGKSISMTGGHKKGTSYKVSKQNEVITFTIIGS